MTADAADDTEKVHGEMRGHELRNQWEDVKSFLKFF